MSVNYFQNATLQGLGTLTIVVPDAGVYYINGQVSLPSISAGSSANSSVVVTITQNGTTRYTGAAGDRGFHLERALSASDSIAIITSSSAAVDQDSNSIKTVIQIGRDS